MILPGDSCPSCGHDLLDEHYRNGTGCCRHKSMVTDYTRERQRPDTEATVGSTVFCMCPGLGTLAEKYRKLFAHG
jgi:hypothetical protein